MESEIVFDFEQIRELLIHRYPFLLVDRVTELVEGEKIVAEKCISGNEQFFQGHFPEKAVMPGVLIMEAMAQAAAILMKVSLYKDKPAQPILLVGADNFRWKRMVVPGDRLVIEAHFVKSRRQMYVIEGVASVDGKMVAKGNLSAIAQDSF